MNLNWKHHHITSNATVITTLDTHAAGEPSRIDDDRFVYEGMKP